ncbi:uridine kinase family protein [Peterkaempfera bronchialis]|uniref:uridine kinase family protein n=1 Tax=Peterkaempfera bronchialis TaxID=2126346 RepID=UPI002245A6B5|nr:AAA family ATPase [Peterkaempfera bronchialis]
MVAATGWDGGGRPSVERVVEAVARLTSGAPGGAAATRLVAVDGPGGSGKSTLAAAVAERLPGGAAATAVVHGDDFYRPMDEQERAGLSPEQGYRRYFDWERLRQEVLEPLRAGRPARYRRYDWATGALGGWAEEVRPGGVVLVEGVYTARPELERWYDLTVWVHTSREECLRRVRARGENDEAWIVRWRAAEEYGATATRPELRAGLVVGGA